MNAYPDASFLVALYIRQRNTEIASKHAGTLKESIPVSSLLRFEVCNAIRREAFQGRITSGAAVAALAAFEADVDNGVIVIPSVEWEQVHAEAERLSNAPGLRHGYRAFDVLHVATAVTLGVREFLTFDAHQASLAKAAGLKAKLVST